jgi:GT2 family glycosyltransferase
MSLGKPSDSPFRALLECLEGETPFAVRVVDVEEGVDDLQLRSSRSGEPYRQLLALVRRGGYPLGWTRIPIANDGKVSLNGLAALADEVPIPTASDARDNVGDEAMRPLLTVVIATCASVESTIRCVEAIRAGDDGPLEVVVVENRPRGSTVRIALEEHFLDGPPVRYVEETRPGLANARNAGLREARGTLVAFTDDDVIVDAAWAPAIRHAFAAMPQVDCVTGLIAPLEFETAAQVRLERFANYGKGFDARLYSLERPPPDQPLFPYTAGHLGSGANMAFRTEKLRALRGFDPALGTGTPARGSEDLDIYIRLIHAGGELAYEPRAIVWHRHPNTEDGLRRRAFDYGVALGALVGKHIVMESHRWAIIALMPKGFRYLTDPKSRKNASRDRTFPRRLVWLERVGFIYGPIAYLTSRLRTSR